MQTSSVERTPSHGLADARLRWEAQGYASAVVSTMLQAWAPSSKECYRPKWEAFKAWCSEKSLDLFICPLQRVLEYLNILLDRRLAPATIRVYAAAINVHRDRKAEPIFTSPAGQLFFKGLAFGRDLPLPPGTWLRCWTCSAEPLSNHWFKH